MAKYGKMQNPEGSGGESTEKPFGGGNLHSGSINTHVAPHHDGKDQYADFAADELGWKDSAKHKGHSVGKAKHSAHDKETGFIKR